MPQKLLLFTLSTGGIIPSFIMTYSILTQALDEIGQETTRKRGVGISLRKDGAGEKVKVDAGSKVSA